MLFYGISSKKVISLNIIYKNCFTPPPKGSWNPENCFGGGEAKAQEPLPSRALFLSFWPPCNGAWMSLGRSIYICPSFHAKNYRIPPQPPHGNGLNPWQNNSFLPCVVSASTLSQWYVSNPSTKWTMQPEIEPVHKVFLWKIPACAREKSRKNMGKEEIQPRGVAQLCFCPQGIQAPLQVSWNERTKLDWAVGLLDLGLAFFLMVCSVTTPLLWRRTRDKALLGYIQWNRSLRQYFVKQQLSLFCSNRAL